MKEISEGGIDIQEKVCNIGKVEQKLYLWKILWVNIFNNSKEPNFGHIPSIVYQYVYKLAKTKYFELLHYVNKHKFSISDAIRIVILFITV